MTTDIDTGIVFQPPRGVKPKPPRFAGKHFLKARSEGAPTTTRQAEVLNTAIIGTPGDNRGVVIGTDQLSGGMIAHDPFTAYEGHRITSPNVCLIGSLGSGKALDVDTPIATPTGWARMGDLRVGDMVFDETGLPTRIVAVSDVLTDRECFAVRFSDGSVIVADADHLWVTQDRLERMRPARAKARPLKRRRLGTTDEIQLCHDLLQNEPDRFVGVLELLRLIGAPATRNHAVHRWLQDTPRRADKRYRLGDAVPAILPYLERCWGDWNDRGRVPVTTRQLSTSLLYQGQANHAVQVAAPLTLPDVDLLVPAYVLGAWLGDGTSSSPALTTADPEMLTYIEAAGYETIYRGRYLHTIKIPRAPETAHHTEQVCITCEQTFTTSYPGQRACSRKCQVRRTGIAPRLCLSCGNAMPKGSTGIRHQTCFSERTFTGQLRALGVLNNKHIPDQYLWASESQRRALLAGLLDTDGTVEPQGAVSFTACNERLAQQVRELVCSLGYRAAMNSRPAKLGGRTVGTAWTVNFTTTDDVFRLERKRLALKERSARHRPERTRWRYIVGVDPVESRPVRCIQVAADSSMYLAGEAMIPTHNSSLLKSVYVMRPLTMRGRRAVVMDKKMRDGEGEYAEVTRQHGAEPFRFDPDDPRGSTCMNVLDPVILAGGGPAVQRQLLSAVAELAGDGPLDEWHNAALTHAYNATMAKFDGGRTPIIPDLIEQIPGVVNAPEFAGLRSSTLDLIERSAWSLRFRLERLLADDLAGMFGGETSKHVTLHPKLTTFDISALPEDGPATSMVMVVANAWLMGMLTHDRGWRTSFIAEEGWHLLAGPGGKVIRSKSKLSRGLGLSIVAAIHHISDIPAGSDAIAMIKEAQTIHLFRQEHDTDIQDCVKYFGLEASNASVLGSLPQGDHLLKVGSHKEIRVRHVRTEREVQFTETDAAMLLPEPAKVTV